MALEIRQAQFSNALPHIHHSLILLKKILFLSWHLWFYLYVYKMILSFYNQRSLLIVIHSSMIRDQIECLWHSFFTALRDVWNTKDVLCLGECTYTMTFFTLLPFYGRLLLNRSISLMWLVEICQLLLILLRSLRWDRWIFHDWITISCRKCKDLWKYIRRLLFLSIFKLRLSPSQYRIFYNELSPVIFRGHIRRIIAPWPRPRIWSCNIGCPACRFFHYS